MKRNEREEKELKSYIKKIYLLSWHALNLSNFYILFILYYIIILYMCVYSYIIICMYIPYYTIIQ